jgi:NitT/TauT family transport system permease protein
MSRSERHTRYGEIAKARARLYGAARVPTRQQTLLMTSRLTLLGLQILVAVIALAVWHIGSTVPFGLGGDGKPWFLLPEFFFSQPMKVAERVFDLFWTGKIWRHLWITLLEGMLAFLIGSALGVALGFWFARKPLLSAVFDPYIKMMNALPRVVLAPIFMLWFGLGIWSKVVLGVTLVFFIVFFNVYQGVKEVNPVILSNARMLGMSERQLLRHVYWPSALSWMFSSLHTSVGFAIIGAVVGEYLGASAGLGYLIHQAEGVFDITGVLAGMVILMAFVLVIDWLVTQAENRLLVWRPQVQQT